MLDIKSIRENEQQVRALLERRGGDYDIGGLLKMDRDRLHLVNKTDELKRARNEISRTIGARKKSGENVDDIQSESRRIGSEIKELESALKSIESDIRSKLLTIPNTPDETIPEGDDESSNVEIRRWGETPEFTFNPRSHVELGEALGILDFSRAAKIVGARFAVYKGPGAALERALINFMLDIHTREHGYLEVAPPYLANSDTMTGTGQLPKFKDDLFKVSSTDYWLIPTAEAPLTNLYANEILDGANMPVRMCAFTPCFRSEAGSYGRDTTGLIRQHQFNKVELVKLVYSEEAESELEKLTDNAEEILRRLNLPYRVVNLCVGDLGFSAAKTYDLEVWIPSQGKYREISSCSWFTDYQARRANIRVRRGKKSKPEHVHTLNGSGLAVGRTVVAIMENMQSDDGSITIPEALRPYMNGLEIIR